uniref:Secreted protein n=1 Tax=Magnetospirillum gryphiswaldense TaxID=55518 RepID=A4U343_9PROT|nr:secreted protein [Magnetospirillum gryphiswaldense MSR-1]
MRQCIALAAALAAFPAWAGQLSYPPVDTNQRQCYDQNGRPGCAGGPAGQDAAYAGRQPRYDDNGDGTVSDLVTGLDVQREFSHAAWLRPRRWRRAHATAVMPIGECRPSRNFIP